MEIIMKKIKMYGYMTIEASAIIPMTVFLIVFIIYLSFYLYNLCLLKQVAYTSALRGSQILTGTDAEIKTYVEAQIEQLIGEKLILVESWEKEVSVSLGNVEVKLYGDMNPLFLNNFGLETTWDLKSEGLAKRIDPVTFIRLIRMGGD